MRMIMNVSIPNSRFNAAVREGTAGQTIARILEDARPEATYFTEERGRRTAVLVVNVDDQSQIPSFTEPWFLAFDAECRVCIAMTPEDLAKAGLEDLGKKWT